MQGGQRYFEVKQNPFRYDALGKMIEFPEHVKLPKNLLLSPELSTLREISWKKKECMVMADVYDPDSKTPLPYAPRQILK